MKRDFTLVKNGDMFYDEVQIEKNCKSTCMVTSSKDYTNVATVQVITVSVSINCNSGGRQIP